MIYQENLEITQNLCLKAPLDEEKLYHRRFFHASMQTFKKHNHENLVRSILKLEYLNDHLYDACMRKK